MRRLTALTAALAFALLGAGGLPAYADDDPSTPAAQPSPTGTPPNRPGDPFGGQTLPPGPVYVITPGSPSTALPPTSNPHTVEQQVKKDVAKARTESPSALPTGTSTPTPTAGVTVTATDGVPASGGDSSGEAVDLATPSSSSPWLWWVFCTAVLALAVGGVIVLRLRRRRASDAGVA